MSLTNYFRTDGWVKSALGVASSVAQVYVCTQPASTTTVPPSPLASIFSDPNGFVPISQPLKTDAFGHYNFYATAGVYTVVVVILGKIQNVYPDQSVGGGGSAGITTGLALQVNSVPASSQFIQNLTPGAGTTITDGGGGQITIGNTVSGVQTVYYMIGPGLVTPKTPDTLIAGFYPSITSALEVAVLHFNFPYQLAFTTVRFQYQTASSGVHVSFGIYSGPSSATPGTLLWSVQSISLPNFAAGTENLSVTPYTLVPGDYYLAMSTDANFGGLQIIGLNLGATNTGKTSTVMNQIQPLYGEATNPATGQAVLPNTLGTILIDANGNTISWPLIMFS